MTDLGFDVHVTVEPDREDPVVKEFVPKQAPSVAFAYSSDGDWMGMYVDGYLVYEGHSIDEREVVKAVGLSFESHEFYYGEPDDGAENPFYAEGNFPYSYAELQRWCGTPAYRGGWSG